jgi:hypothetical protein
MSRSSATAITDKQAWMLLAATRSGRLVTTSSGTTREFSVGFAVDVDTLVFRTGAEWPLLRLALGSPVTLTVEDDWVVSVTGTAAAIVNPFEVALAERLPFEPWTSESGPVFLRITPTEVTGYYAEEQTAGAQ